MSRLTEMNTLLGSLLGEKKSHPNKLLFTHLQNAADFAGKLAANQGIDIDENLLLAIVWTHDLGKVHPKFQKLLDGIGAGINHAKPSARFTFSITEDIWAAEIVCRHHTGLRNLDDLIADWVNDHNFEKDMKNLLPAWPFMISKEQFENLQDVLFDLKYEIKIDHWLKVRLLYSLLVSADRMDAIGIRSLPKKVIPPFSQPKLPIRSAKLIIGVRILKIPVFKEQKILINQVYIH
jgi:CRISPR-associated endonuclease/helicase Cas3